MFTGHPSPPHHAPPLPPRKSDWVLYLIAADKLIKGCLVTGMGIVAFRLAHENLHDTVLKWAGRLHIAPGNHYLDYILEHTLNISPANLRFLGFGLFIYAALYLVEGTGLVFRKTWAEWVVVISTTLFVPIEIFELYHRFTWFKVLVSLVNILIVLYLISRLRREHRAKISLKPSPPLPPTPSPPPTPPPSP